MEPQNGSVPLFLVYNFRTLLGVSLLLFSFCLKLRDVSGCGELTSMQWGRGYSNWCDICLGLGLIAGLSAIAAGFSPLHCRWLNPLISETLVSAQVWQHFSPSFLDPQHTRMKSALPRLNPNRLRWSKSAFSILPVQDLVSCLQNQLMLERKVCFTACFGGKLKLACTSPRVKIFDEQNWLQFFCNLNSSKKLHLPVTP